MQFSAFSSKVTMCDALLEMIEVIPIFYFWRKKNLVSKCVAHSESSIFSCEIPLSLTLRHSFFSNRFWVVLEWDHKQIQPGKSGSIVEL